MNNRPSDYKHIAAWGRRMGSFAYYIHDQQVKACEAGAPINAIYEKYAENGTGPTGVWITADQIQTPELRESIENAVREMGAPA